MHKISSYNACMYSLQEIIMMEDNFSQGTRRKVKGRLFVYEARMYVRGTMACNETQSLTSYDDTAFLKRDVVVVIPQSVDSFLFSMKVDASAAR